MVFEHIENLKKEYTDKYVVVDNQRPELRRFEGQTGLVRTVNMSGRALVEFDAHLNIGWFDIDVDYLKIIDKPLAKPEPKAAPAKKPAAKKPTAKAADKPASGGMSVAEMMAAARGEKGDDAATPVKTKPKTDATKPAVAAAAGMSVAEMMAAARGEKSSAKAEAVAEPAAEPETETQEETPVEEAAAEEAAASGITPKSELPTDTASIVEFCRKTDGS